MTDAKRGFITGVLSATPLAAGLVWFVALRGTDLDRITDLGLITAIQPAAFAALGLLIFSFCCAIAQPRLSVWLLALHVVVLIFCLYGAAAIAEGHARTAVAWKLVGIMDHVMLYGTVDPARDAFQNWPGFFILVAFLTSAAGMPSPLVLAPWAPVFFSLLYLGPLLLLYRVATNDQRLIWLGIWFFYLANWIGQDYLAPQAFGYFFYLLTLGILLNWFKDEAGDRWLNSWRRYALIDRISRAIRFQPKDSSAQTVAIVPARVQAGLMLVLVSFAGVITPSHQLSPVALMGAVAMLVILRRITPRGLPLILGVMIAGYISYMTVAYLSGHISVLTEPLGDLGSNLDQNVTARLRGSEEHVLVVTFRIFISVAIWAAAGLGVMHRWLRGSRDLDFILLAAAPFVMLGLQTYGGELLLRVFLFSLPFMAFFIGGLFSPLPQIGMSRPVWLVALGLSMALSVSYFLARYGNERMDYFTDDEVAAVQYIYAEAGPHTQVVAGNETLPWRYQKYNTYHYETMERAVHDNDLDAVHGIMARDQYGQSFLILTRGQRASAELFAGWELGIWERFEKTVADSPEFELVFSNADAKVYILTPKAEEP